MKAWRVKKGSRHPWVIEAESNIPGAPAKICECSYKPFAQLIAAAPEMLDSLKQVLPYMAAAEDEGLVGDEGCHWPVESVRAAIEKAEGVTDSGGAHA